MMRVHVICEGQTEEMFVNEVLASSFVGKQIYLVPALVGKPGHKGGYFSFQRLLGDVRNRLLGEHRAWCTTFFDFYGLPESFPGKLEARTKVDLHEKADCLLEAMRMELSSVLGEDPMRRFIPYVQMYEFEGLLFSAPQQLANAIGRPTLGVDFQRIRDGFDSPEGINDSPITAPSKRISSLYQGYEKPLHGSLAAMDVGLSVIRRECTRFDAWLRQIEALPELVE